MEWVLMVIWQIHRIGVGHYEYDCDRYVHLISFLSISEGKILICSLCYRNEFCYYEEGTATAR